MVGSQGTNDWFSTLLADSKVSDDVLNLKVPRAQKQRSSVALGPIKGKRKKATEAIVQPSRRRKQAAAELPVYAQDFGEEVDSFAKPNPFTPPPSSASRTQEPTTWRSRWAASSREQPAQPAATSRVTDHSEGAQKPTPPPQPGRFISKEQVPWPPLRAHTPPSDPSQVPVTKVPSRYQSVFHGSFSHFNRMQSAMFNTLLDTDANIVVTAPTGAGKTVVFELAMCRAIDQLGPGQKILYLGPLKALCKEKAADWKSKFSSVGVSCIELTSDTGDDQSWHDKDILVATPEKWDNLTRHKSELIGKLALVLIDEVQNLGESRGPALEAVVSRMKVLRQKNPMRFVAVSATCPNAKDIGQWLNNATVQVFGEEFRPVQLETHVKGYPCRDNHFLFLRSLKYRLFEVIVQYYDRRPTLVFCSSRKDSALAAQQVAQETSRLNNPFILTDPQRQKLRIASQELGESTLRAAVAEGVGYYHAGLSVRDRDIMQRLFTSGSLLVLCSTSCFSQGVNLPARLVVILGTEMYRAGGYEEASIVDTLQMIGRAGRPQFDTHGVAVVMTRESTRSRYEDLVHGMENIESSLLDSLSTHLNSEIVLGTIQSVKQAIDWLSSTFLYVRLTQNPSHYGFPKGVSSETLTDSLRKLCLTGVRELDSFQMIKLDPSSRVHSCEQGRIMAHCCIDFDTMKAMSELNADSTMCDVLIVLSRAKEVSSSTLRRAEKSSLNELHALVRYPLEQESSSKRRKKPKLKRIQSNSEKIFVLIQAVLGSLEIKDPALRQEGQHIMAALGRVLSGLAMSLIDKQHYSPLKCALQLQQSVAQKVWFDSQHLVRQLEGIGQKFSSLLTGVGLGTFEAIQQAAPYRIETVLSRRPPFGSKVKESLAKIWPEFRLTATVKGRTLTVVAEPHNPLKRAGKRFQKGLYSAIVVSTESGAFLNGDGRVTNSSRTQRTVAVPAGTSGVVVELFSTDFIGMNKVVCLDLGEEKRQLLTAPPKDSPPILAKIDDPGVFDALALVEESDDDSEDLALEELLRDIEDRAVPMPAQPSDAQVGSSFGSRAAASPRKVRPLPHANNTVNEHPIEVLPAVSAARLASSRHASHRSSSRPPSPCKPVVGTPDVDRHQGHVELDEEIAHLQLLLERKQAERAAAAALSPASSDRASTSADPAPLPRRPNKGSLWFQRAKAYRSTAPE